MRQIWSEIYKPEQHANSQPGDFFQFEFVMMPHKIFQPDEFTAKAAELRERFSLQAQDGIFNPDSEDSNVPSDGLPVFVDQTWAVIRTQKELNLPGQREMVANFRCNEMKLEALAKVKERVEALEQQCQKQLIENFGASCTEVMTEALELYHDAAKQYNKEVQEKV